MIPPVGPPNPLENPQIPQNLDDPVPDEISGQGVKKSLPKRIKEKLPKASDAVKLKNSVDDLVSLKEDIDKSSLKLRIGLGITIGVLLLPVAVGAWIVGGILGAGVGIIKNRFMWDYEYDKAEKTLPMGKINIGPLRSIKGEAFRGAQIVGYYTTIGLKIGLEALDRLREINRKEAIADVKINRLTPEFIANLKKRKKLTPLDRALPTFLRFNPTVIKKIKLEKSVQEIAAMEKERDRKRLIARAVIGFTLGVLLLPLTLGLGYFDINRVTDQAIVLNALHELGLISDKTIITAQLSSNIVKFSYLPALGLIVWADAIQKLINIKKAEGNTP